MIVKKSKDKEIVIDAAGRLKGVLDAVIARVAVGVRGVELDAYAERLIRAAGGEPAFKGYGSPPFPGTLCISINECVVHGVPSERLFAAGDIIGLDIGMHYQGFYTDMARTVVLAPISSREAELVRVAREALDDALAYVRPGITTGDLGARIQKKVEAHGFGVVRDLAGHGLGHALHEGPELPNFGTPGAGVRITEGMLLAIEPMITLGNWRLRVARDGWSMCTADKSKTAHEEDMVLITKRGAIVLTQ